MEFKMNMIEIVSAILLLLSSVLMIIVVAMQEGRQNGLSGAVMGGGSDSHFGKNRGRSHDAKLVNITKVLAVLLFAGTFAVTIVAVFFK